MGIKGRVKNCGGMGNCGRDPEWWALPRNVGKMAILVGKRSCRKGGKLWEHKENCGRDLMIVAKNCGRDRELGETQKL